MMRRKTKGRQKKGGEGDEGWEGRRRQTGTVSAVLENYPGNWEKTDAYRATDDDSDGTPWFRAVLAR